MRAHIRVMFLRHICVFNIFSELSCLCNMFTWWVSKRKQCDKTASAVYWHCQYPALLRRHTGWEVLFYKLSGWWLLVWPCKSLKCSCNSTSFLQNLFKSYWKPPELIILQYLTCKIWEDFHLAKSNWYDRMPRSHKTGIIRYFIILLKRR